MRSEQMIVYHVPRSKCTDIEPRTGWYVSFGEDVICGPFDTRDEAMRVTNRRCEGGPVDHWGECFECDAAAGQDCLKPVEDAHKVRGF